MKPKTMEGKMKKEEKYQAGDATRTQMLKEAGLTLEQYKNACVSVEEFIKLVGIKEVEYYSYMMRKLVTTVCDLHEEANNRKRAEKEGNGYYEYFDGKIRAFMEIYDYIFGTKEGKERGEVKTSPHEIERTDHLLRKHEPCLECEGWTTQEALRLKRYCSLCGRRMNPRQEVGE